MNAGSTRRHTFEHSNRASRRSRRADALGLQMSPPDTGRSGSWGGRGRTRHTPQNRPVDGGDTPREGPRPERWCSSSSPRASDHVPVRIARTDRTHRGVCAPDSRRVRPYAAPKPSRRVQDMIPAAASAHAFRALTAARRSDFGVGATGVPSTRLPRPSRAKHGASSAGARGRECRRPGRDPDPVRARLRELGARARRGANREKSPQPPSKLAATPSNQH